MNSNTNKTELFRRAINADADARCAQIRSEVDSYVENELKKTRRLAHQNVRPVRNSEFDRLNEEINTELSETEIKETEKLVLKRSKMTDDIFTKAEQRIIDFAKSDEYHNFILGSISNIKSAIGDDCIIILKPEDKIFESEIKALGNEVRYDATIALGGCKGENLRSCITADDTLDSRLEAEKKSFYEYSKLYLSL